MDGLSRVYPPLWTVKPGGHLNATAASLLGLLDMHGGELTGGELVRLAETRLGEFWSLTRSQIYRELGTLERDGYIAPGSPGPRDARPVGITESGRDVYRHWLTERLPSDTIRIPVLLSVAFGDALPADALRRVLARSLREHRERLQGYRQLDADLAGLPVGEPWARATVSFGVHYEEAVLRWFATLPEEVRPEGVQPEGVQPEGGAAR